MKQLKLWMSLICFAQGFNSSEGKKCCVSRAYAECWVTPNFWENALTDENKKKRKLKSYSQFSLYHKINNSYLEIQIKKKKTTVQCVFLSYF